MRIRFDSMPVYVPSLDAFLSVDTALRGMVDELIDPSKLAPLGFGPAVDVAEHSDRYEIVAELPGVRKEDLKISVNKGELTLHAERKALKPEGKVRVMHRELSDSQTFTRSFALPTGVDAAKISAELTDGVLRIELPKAEEIRPREIHVK